MSTPVTETVDKGKSKVAFARRAQNWVMAFLIISLLCVAQPFSLQLYGYGIFLLGIAVFLQIAVSNVTPTAGVRATVVKSVIIIAVIIAIFAFSIWVTPILVEMGR